MLLFYNDLQQYFEHWQILNIPMIAPIIRLIQLTMLKNSITLIGKLNFLQQVFEVLQPFDEVLQPFDEVLQPFDEVQHYDEQQPNIDSRSFKMMNPNANSITTAIPMTDPENESSLALKFKK